MLQPHDFRGRFAHEGFDHVLVGDVVAALDRVVGVRLPAVLGPQRGRGPALGGDRVAAHRVDLGDDADPEAALGLGGGYGGSQSRRSTSDHEDVETGKVQADFNPIRWAWLPCA